MQTVSVPSSATLPLAQAAVVVQPAGHTEQAMQLVLVPLPLTAAPGEHVCDTRKPALHVLQLASAVSVVAVQAAAANVALARGTLHAGTPAAAATHV